MHGISQASDGYQFLGNVDSFSQIESGIVLHCENEQELHVRFLKPNMVRVVLQRPQFRQPLLDYPLAKTDWPAVEVKLQQEPARLVLVSSELKVVIQKSPCRLKILDNTGKVICEDDPGMGIGWNGREVRNWKTIAADEKFFGLGEKTGNVNKRGQEWVMWNTDDPHHDNHSDPLYQSIPFFVGMRDFQAYGIYFNNSYRSRFNMGAGNLRYYSFAAESGNLDYFFIHGPEVSRVVETYTELTGRMQMPPRWALGYQQCRWSYYPDKEVLRIAETFREKEIPADVIYLDIHYMDGYRVFTWDRKRFPDPVGLVAALQEIGFKVVVIIDPGVKVEPDYEVAQEGLAGDHFVKYPDGQVYTGEVWPGESYFPDFSRPETREWWGGKFKALLDSGIQGFWNDMNEPAVWGRAFPDEVLFYDEGRISSHKKMHNLYGFLMAKTSYDAVRHHRPDSRPFIITRAGFAGEQRFTAVWTGDNQATEEHLELGIRMLLGMGISGLPFIGPDVGGFGGTPSPELYARWLQSAVFTPFFRTHSHYGSSDQEPWSFGEEIEQISGKFIRLRYRMLPHLYSLMWQAHQTGAPIMRPMFWHHQTEAEVYEQAYQEQFCVGEGLLIAPVTRVGQRLKKVYLPAGVWLDLNTETVYRGGQTVIVEAPLDRLPMFLRAGAMLVSREPEQYVGEKNLDKLIVDILPEAPAGYQLYEDDGESQDYADGAYRLTQFDLTGDLTQSMTFTKSRTHDGLTLPERSILIRLHGLENDFGPVSLDGSELKQIQSDSKADGVYHDPTGKTLCIQFKDHGNKQTVKIVRK